MFSLKGRTALVAGASRGIGLAIAQQMAAAGARTILAARSRDALTERVRELTTDGYDARAMELDISRPASVEAAADSLESVDILVNVAGTNVRKRFEDYSRDEYDRLLETNLHGIVRLTQKLGAKNDRARHRRQGDQHRQHDVAARAALPFRVRHHQRRSARS